MQIELSESKKEQRQNYEYIRQIGQHKPMFEGRPDGYYELSCGEICCGTLVCFLIIGIQIALLIGYFIWTVNINTETFALAWTILLIVFIFIVGIASYCCSKDKKQQQALIIRNAVAKEVKRQALYQVEDSKVKFQQDA